MNDWPDEVFGIKVEHMPLGDSSAGALLAPVSLVEHTAEGSVEGTIAVFRSNPGLASHAVAGAGSDGKPRIVQFRSLSKRGGSLRGDTTNDPYCIQIELATFSKTTLWRPPPAVWAAGAAFGAYAAMMHSIPMKRPNPTWKDDGSDMPFPWATESNERRRWAAGRFPDVRGVWQHLEIPGNTHWDCGAMAISDLIETMSELMEGGDVSAADVREAFGVTDPKSKVLHNTTQFEAGKLDFERGRLRDSIVPENTDRIRGWDHAKKLDTAARAAGYVDPA